MERYLVLSLRNFDDETLTKPGKCPSCRNSRIFEPQISVEIT